MGAVRPYVYGRSDLVELLKHAFDAEEIERAATGSGFHVELRIADSIVVLETGDSFPGPTTHASVYVYVDDVDVAYACAIEAGALSLAAPEDKPYGERGAGVRDSFGNTWWIATFTDRPADATAS